MKFSIDFQVAVKHAPGSLSRIVTLNGEYIGVASEYNGLWTAVSGPGDLLCDGEPFVDLRAAVAVIIAVALNITWTDEGQP